MKVICILTALMIFSLQELSSQRKADYSELELYHGTLSPEYTQAYQTALRIYNRSLRIDSVSTDKNPETIDIKELSQRFDESFRGDSVNYTFAFILALELETLLDNITEEQYPDKRADYFRLGEAYYLFNDFEKSITILEKAVTDSLPRSFTDRANLDARKIIGICYANLNKMDISDYYFRSILDSPDMVLDRPVYNAYALSYLGCNAMIRGEYTKALILDDAVLPYFRTYTDYGHLAGMYYCRSTSYYNLGDITQSGLAADSILIYANKDTYHPNKRRKQAFSALIRYNAVTGNAFLTKAYSDSLVNIYRQEAKTYTSQYIADAWWVKYEQESAQEKEKSVIYRRNMIAGFIVSIIAILLVGYTYIQYHRLRIAYRVLAEKSRQWAEQIAEEYNLNSEEIPKNSSTEEVYIMQQVREYVISEKGYLDSELSLDKLSKELNINRSYLSSAINKVMGKNFSAYVNEYRISEAIRILNGTIKNPLTIDDVYLACGFNNKRSFYNYFKKVTGITPGEYRGNIENTLSEN